jgi:hypothetical protein
VIDYSHKNTVVHEEQLEHILSEETRLTTLLPRDEHRLLSHFELYRYEGAIAALRWLLGQHNHNLVVYLAGDHFELVIETVGKSKEIASGNATYTKGKAGPTLCRNMKKIKKQLYCLRILDELQPPLCCCSHVAGRPEPRQLTERDRATGALVPAPKRL